MIQLRDYQNEAIITILNARGRGVLRQLVALPTGTGKTVIFATLARDLSMRTLILAHRDELISQAADKLSMVWPGVDVGIVKAQRNEIDRQVTLASVQTLARPGRLEALGTYELIITDEAHHAAAPTYRRIYSRLGDVFLHVGVTATPQRGDKAALNGVFDEIVYSKDLLEMIKAGYLCDLQGLRLRTDVDLSDVRSTAGDFVESDLANAVNTPERNQAIVETWQEHCQGRQTLAFTVDVAHALDLAEAFQQAGVQALAVSGQMPIEDRRAALEAFRNGDIEVLCNCALLTEGYDHPAVGCIIIARPTQSQACYIQMVGRGTRLYPGKTTCLIVDVADNTQRHTLVQLPSLFGLEYHVRTDGKPTKGILEQVRESQEAGQPLSRTVEHVDLFGRSRFNWLSVGDNWFLPIPGHGQIRLQPVNDNYWPLLYLSGGQRQYLSDKPLDLAWAQGIAEERARHLLDDRLLLVRKDAAWRREPASAKQLDTLRKMRLAFRPGITKGEASDLIGQQIASLQSTSRWRA